MEEIESMMGSEHRVLFQNADSNINMGAIFNDPDFQLYDIYWYLVLAEQMNASLVRNEGLITVDRESNTTSCYVELHRNGEQIYKLNIQYVTYFKYRFVYSLNCLG